MRKLPLFAVVIFVTLISGCTKKDWWVGTWKMDMAATEQHMTADPQIKEKVAENLKKMFERVGEWQVTITPTDIMAGTDEKMKKPYKVVAPTKTSVVLQGEERSANCTLDGEYMVADFAKNMPVKLYFKRVK